MADSPTDEPRAPRKRAPADGAKRQPRGEARRQAILDAAIEALARKGQRGLRLTELAEGLGIKHSHLIYYFGSKARLLSEAVEERERRERWFYRIPDEMVSLGELYDAAKLIKENALFTRLYIVLAAESLDPDDSLHEFFVNRYDRARQRIVTAVTTDKAAGRVRPDADAEQISYEVISMMMGLEIQWLMDPDNVDYLAVMRKYTEQLHDRFAVPESERAADE
ncbi:TetR/AcrR family transcriptional regulator [Actinomadura atramentaria]|uniref:TetR/AcrR family transcriptional regulator n=1 Tax=Actinomadura atramentaria TaxID=1990 RepID=UPI000363CF1B|nr:TetR family transcriptional regulator [Actinomadura atramentaria]